MGAYIEKVERKALEISRLLPLVGWIAEY